jgi:hypothetical protein
MEANTGAVFLFFQRGMRNNERPTMIDSTEPGGSLALASRNFLKNLEISMVTLE